MAASLVVMVYGGGKQIKISAAPCSTPPEALTMKRSPPEVRAPNTAPDRLRALARASAKAARAVAGRPDAPGDLVAELARSTDWRTRAAVGRREDAPEESLAALALDPVAHVRRAVAGRLGAGAEVPGAIMLRLSQDADLLVRRTVAAFSGMPEEVRRVLAKDRDVGVQLNVLRSGASPSVEVLTALSASRSSAVRRGLLLTHYALLPEPILAQMLNDRDGGVRAAAVGPRTPVEVLIRLASDPYWPVRCWVARCAATPESTLSALAEDPEPDVRCEAVKHPRLPGDAVLKRVRDPMPSVRAAAALSDKLSIEAYEELLRLPHYDVWWALAANPAAPPSVLRALHREHAAVDRLGRIAARLAENPSMPKDVLETLPR